MFDGNAARTLRKSEHDDEVILEKVIENKLKDHLSHSEIGKAKHAFHKTYKHTYLDCVRTSQNQHHLKGLAIAIEQSANLAANHERLSLKPEVVMEMLATISGALVGAIEHAFSYTKPIDQNDEARIYTVALNLHHAGFEDVREVIEKRIDHFMKKNYHRMQKSYADQMNRVILLLKLHKNISIPRYRG